MRKVARMTEAFGGERRRRAIAAAQRNKLDAETLDSTLISAVALAQENTRQEGVCVSIVRGLYVWTVCSTDCV